LLPIKADTNSNKVLFGWWKFVMSAFAMFILHDGAIIKAVLA
jgi:hypothetical protein